MKKIGIELARYQNNMTLAGTFFLPMLLMVICTPLIISISHRLDLADHPNQRKIHTHYISRFGGVGVFFSICTSLFFAFFLNQAHWEKNFWLPLIFGSVLAFVIGFWDDLKNIPAKQKLLFQIVLAFVAYFTGFRINQIQFGFEHPIHFGHLTLPVTIFWIVMVMNAFNMIDGLDGLAGGIAFFVFLTISLLGFINGNANVMIMSMICAGACFGFLLFNYHPAKIFMGDGGSMMLGYILATLSISSRIDHVSPSFFTPFLLLAFPLIDLTTAVFRRMIHAKIKNKHISYGALIRKTFDADGNHIHHRLLKLGFSQRKITSMIYLFTVFSCGLSLISIYFSFGLIFFLFIFYLWFVVQIIRLLDYEEFMTGEYRKQKKDLEEKQKLSTSPSLIQKVL